jgi:hypothetical protein
MTPDKAFIAIRHSADGYDWLDIATASGARDVCQDNASKTDAQIPQWAKANPIVRIACFTLSEVR